MAKTVEGTLYVNPPSYEGNPPVPVYAGSSATMRVELDSRVVDQLSSAEAGTSLEIAARVSSVPFGGYTARQFAELRVGGRNVGAAEITKPRPGGGGMLEVNVGDSVTLKLTRLGSQKG